MNYRQLYEHLKGLKPEQLDREVVLYDTIGGNTYTPNGFRLGGEGDRDLNIPDTDDITTIITF